MIAVKLGCDRSGDAAMATDFCLFNPYNFFLHSDQCVINFVYSATTRSTVVGVKLEVDRLFDRGDASPTPQLFWTEIRAS